MQTHIGESAIARLTPGQTLRLYVDAGIHIVVVRGRVTVVEAPVWLTDQFLEQRMIVCDGERHVVQWSGWIAVEAHETAEVACVDTCSGAKGDSSYQRWAGFGQIFARLRRFRWFA